jgi:hypothetical protein
VSTLEMKQASKQASKQQGKKETADLPFKLLLHRFDHSFISIQGTAEAEALHSLEALLLNFDPIYFLCQKNTDTISCRHFARVAHFQIFLRRTSGSGRSDE